MIPELISFLLQLISTIFYIIGGIVGTTKYALKARVQMYLNLFLIVANTLWMTDCIIDGDFMYASVGALFIILGVIGTINFRRIHRKGIERLHEAMSGKSSPYIPLEKKVVGFNLPENYYSCKKFNTEYEYCDCDDCKKERGEKL